MESIDSMESIGSMDSMEDFMGCIDSMAYMGSAGPAWALAQVRARFGPKGQAGP